MQPRTTRPFSQLLRQADPSTRKRLGQSIIRVDPFDKEMGAISLLDAHLMENVHRNVFHRAFSLFCVDKAGNMLIQKRAPSKWTFPSTWSNSVCSHPAFNDQERVVENNLGIKRAAKRRLFEELGVEVPELDRFKPVDTYLYKTPFNDLLGEAECELSSRPHRAPGTRL